VAGRIDRGEIHMLEHVKIHHPAHLVFTRDFHELLRGRLDRGTSCTISYDPARIVPPDEAYNFGDPNRPIVAHVQFAEPATVLDLPLESWVGIHTYTPPALMGEGPMLKGVFDVPANAEQVIIWFTFLASDGRTCFDSKHGRNYTFRFLHEDFKLLDAEVSGSGGDLLHRFVLRVEADEEIEQIVVRYRVTNAPGADVERPVDLARTDQPAADGCAVWEADGVLVPANAVVAFDVRYLIAGHWTTSDNQGNYYLATHPAKLAQVPVERAV
jgi:hypothetical protein